MIVVDTGPLVALFDPQDHQHQRCKAILQAMCAPLYTTVPVLTEAFHLLTLASQGSDRLREFILRGGLSLWFLQSDAIERAFELMETYADQAMDLADASLVVAAETLRTRKIFTIDRGDFSTYRIKRGYRHYPFEIIG